MTETEAASKPDFRIFKLDVTEHWTEDMRTSSGTIFDVFIFNAKHRVYCCEMTPSYEMHYLGPTWTKSPEDEKAKEEQFESFVEGIRDADQVQYFHCSSVRLSECEKIGTSDESWSRFLRDADGDSEQAEEACREKWSEYCCCNGWVY